MDDPIARLNLSFTEADEAFRHACEAAVKAYARAADEINAAFAREEPASPNRAIAEAREHDWRCRKKL